MRFFKSLGIFVVSLFHMPSSTNAFGLPTSLKTEIVHSTSAYLSKIDSIGHHVLKHNAEFINLVLQSDLPELLKKEFVLDSIKMAQMGDNMGSHILETYYNLVNHLL